MTDTDNGGFVYACQYIPDVDPIRRDLVVPMFGYSHLPGGNEFLYSLKSLTQFAKPLTFCIGDA